MKIKSIFLTMVFIMLMGMTAYAAEEGAYSEYWRQDAQGVWHIYDGNGVMVRNAWVCDDAVAANGQNIWYLIDANGNMLEAPLVQDGTGNYYSLETNHTGHYGMLRYKSGVYDGINLTLNATHGGSFAAILNTDGIEALRAKYGCTQVSINNSNCVYTSQFRSGAGITSASATASGAAQQQSAPQQQSNSGGIDMRNVDLSKSGVEGWHIDMEDLRAHDGKVWVNSNGN